MNPLRQLNRLRRIAALTAALGCAPFSWAQAAPAQPASSAPVAPPDQSARQGQPAQQDSSVQPDPSVATGQHDQTAPPVVSVAPAATSDSALTAPAKKTYEVPAGTKVLLQLRSSVNTKSAKPGDGVYLASTFPVVVGTRVMIPPGVYVQGVVDNVIRAGRVKGRAQLNLHFTSMIFPNGTVVEIPGIINSLPGAHDQTVKNGEGTVEQAPDKGRNAGEVAKIAIPTGGTVGSIGGLQSGHPIAGGLVGIGAGLAAVGVAALFTRGADVNIESGSQVEMVLQRPLLLEEENLANTGSGGAARDLVPSATQPKPLDKPTSRRARVICPAGGLGCD